MSDSDSSDYNVEEYVIPDTVRRTYNNEDLISDQEKDDSDDGSGDENEAVKEEEELADIPDSQCKLTNGNHTNGVATERKKQEDIVRTNNRFILYVTNLTSTTTKTMIEDFFGDAGAIRSIRIPKVRLGSFAFVEMKDFEGFKVRSLFIGWNHCLKSLNFQAGLKFNNKELDGRKIQVYEGSKNKKHTSTKSRNLKRKTQQQHLSIIKMKNKKINE